MGPDVVVVVVPQGDRPGDPPIITVDYFGSVSRANMRQDIQNLSRAAHWSISEPAIQSRALAATSFRCPVVLFRETTAQGPVVQRETVYAALSLPQLTAEQLVASVRAAAVGLRVSEQEAQRAVGRLDERRLEVLRLLAAGETTKSISAKLAYSERTIKTVIRDLETELSARSRAHAVAEAMRQGLIT